MRLVLFVWLAACGRIGFDEPSVDGAGSVGDADGDGVPDTIDNCSVLANADQANEDGDAFGDACDPCPPFADTNPADDPDHDGVTGPCDPNPNTPGDALALFEGFNRAPSGAEIDGAWSFANDAAVTSSLNSLSAVTWVAPTAASLTVSAFGTADAYFGNAVPRPIGVVTEFAFATNDATMCAFGIDPSNAMVMALADNASALTLVGSVPAVAGVGASTTFALFQRGQMYTCTGSAIVPAALTASSPLTSTPDRIGIFARSASAHFAWLMVVTSP